MHQGEHPFERTFFALSGKCSDVAGSKWTNIQKKYVLQPKGVFDLFKWLLTTNISELDSPR